MTDRADQLYERVLVLRCQTGDEAAFAELVERYQPRLRYYLRKMIRDAHGAEDILQEVWFEVFRAVGRLTDAGAFRAWLYRIAHDRTVRELRKSRPPVKALDGVDAAQPESAADDFTAEDAGRVHAALDEITTEHREVLVLHYLETMSYEDISAVVGCPLGTVRSRLHHARQALRRVLERTMIHD
jgi:RNA polymerase sigma-70 factor (ECF subfamily)